jgi:hypothetical protein
MIFYNDETKQWNLDRTDPDAKLVQLILTDIKPLLKDEKSQKVVNEIIKAIDSKYRYGGPYD